MRQKAMEVTSLRPDYEYGAVYAISTATIILTDAIPGGAGERLGKPDELNKDALLAVALKSLHPRKDAIVDGVHNV